jgi:hypothetical protein
MSYVKNLDWIHKIASEFVGECTTNVDSNDSWAAVHNAKMAI